MGGWDGNGNVTLTYDWTDDAANGIDIEAARMDTQFEDVRGAIEECININGENNVSAGTNRNDVANVAQVQDSTNTWGGTSSGTNAIAFTVSPAITAYVAGQRFLFIAGGDNTGNVTININAVGATAAKRPDGSDIPAAGIKTGEIYQAIYDGTDFAVSALAVRAKPSVVAVTGTSKTLALADGETIQECTNASTQTITIDTNANVAFAVGTAIKVTKYGAGDVNIIGASTVTINGNTESGSSESQETITGQYSSAIATKMDTDNWIVEGAI